jgi:hypothetical protein
MPQLLGVATVEIKARAREPLHPSVIIENELLFLSQEIKRFTNFHPYILLPT